MSKANKKRRQVAPLVHMRHTNLLFYLYSLLNPNSPAYRKSFTLKDNTFESLKQTKNVPRETFSLKGNCFTWNIFIRTSYRPPVNVDAGFTRGVFNGIPDLRGYNDGVAAFFAQMTRCLSAPSVGSVSRLTS